MICVDSLTKTYDSVKAVDDLTFDVRPGIVTGFLGPNGAGKSTTMRMILGLDRPTAGTATVHGKLLQEHYAPLEAIGALLDAGALHPKRSARNHLRVLAKTNGIPTSQVDHVLELVGIASVANRTPGNFSLGMAQRLGIAFALLGDPATVVLDEPMNGLDPEGILWIRGLLKDLAKEGRTVLVSSHLMAEMSLISERFVIIGAGRLIADVTKAELAAKAAHRSVFVRSPDLPRLRNALAGPGVTVSSDAPETMSVTGVSIEDIGRVAASTGAVLFELTPHESSLEEIFMELTRDSVQYRSSVATERQTKGQVA